MLWKETGSAEQKISIPHPLSQTSYHNFVKLIISHLHAACNYRPFIGDHGDARGRTCSRQPHEVLAADVAGEQGGAHLWIHRSRVKCLFTAQWIFDLQKRIYSKLMYMHVLSRDTIQITTTTPFCSIVNKLPDSPEQWSFEGTFSVLTRQFPKEHWQCHMDSLTMLLCKNNVLCFSFCFRSTWVYCAITVWFI